MLINALNPVFSPYAGFKSDSDLNFGYSFFNNNPCKPAGFYDDLLVKFEKKGPILANYGKNTKKIIRK